MPLSCYGAAMKLEEWLFQNDLSAGQFAKAIGVERSTIYRLIWPEPERNRRPGCALVVKIERATSGKVMARDFV